MQKIQNSLSGALTALASSETPSTPAKSSPQRPDTSIPPAVKTSRYRFPHPDQPGKTLFLDAEPDAPMPHGAPQFAASIALMIAMADGRQSLTGHETWFLFEMLANRKATVDETYHAVWGAITDPYIAKDAGIQPRNVARALDEYRSAFISYERLQGEIGAGKATEFDYEITERRGANGKRLWRKRQ